MRCQTRIHYTGGEEKMEAIQLHMQQVQYSEASKPLWLQEIRASWTRRANIPRSLPTMRQQKQRGAARRLRRMQKDKKEDGV